MSARRSVSEAARVQRAGNIGDLSVQPLRGIEPQDTALRVLVELLEGAKLRFGDLRGRVRHTLRIPETPCGALERQCQRGLAADDQECYAGRR